MPTTRTRARKPKPSRDAARFAAPLVQGHKGITPVIVPFDPRLVWDREPVMIDARREGWLVEGTINGVPFAGWIGYRWGRHFIIVEPALRAAAGVAVGDTVDVVVVPTDSAAAMAKAVEQAPLTTAPSRKRRSTVARPPRAPSRRR